MTQESEPSGRTNPDRIELIQRASKRLAIALGVLMLLAFVLSFVRGVTSYVSVIYIAMPAGMIGGFVGLQRRLKHMSIQDLELIARSWLYTGLAPLVGGILASLLFVLFLSGLLRSDLFPTFVSGTTTDPTLFTALLNTKAAGVSDFAKMIFWAFVAGYSERFVTDIIGQFKTTAKKGGPE